MSEQVKVLSLTICDRKPNKAGNSLIALFDCEARGILLRGCALMRTPRGGLTASPPRVETADSKVNGIWITDSTLGNAMMAASRAVYRAMGGTQAEWLPRMETIQSGESEDVTEPDATGLRRFVGGSELAAAAE